MTEEKKRRLKSEAYMKRHNRAKAKAKGVRHIYFSLNPDYWRMLWIRRNPQKARDMGIV